ncbi:nucleoside triphosphate pyrophosphohydrolase family protein [Anaerolineales bacterium]
MSDLSFEEYQQSAKKTAPADSDWLIYYLTMGLVGEAGEIANKVKKILRDQNGELTEPVREAIIDEIGDVMWYMAMLCSQLNVDMSEVAQMNLAKLADRQKRGVIRGSGDDR